MMSREKKRWLIQAPVGLILFAFGLCLVIEAAFLKHGGAALVSWVAWGTVALVVTNAGLAILVDAGLWKIRDEMHPKHRPPDSR